MHCPSFIANNNIWVSLIVGGLANGFLYALIALGYTLVYGVLRLINFAHSEVVMAGGFGGLFAMRVVLGNSTPGGFWAIGFMVIGIVAGALAGGATAFVLERVAYRPLRKRNAPRLTYLISAIGASYFLFNLAGKEFGRFTAFIPTAAVIQGHAFTLCGVGVQSVWILTMVTALVLLLVLDTVVNRTKLGKGIRAVAQDAETASLMGVHIDRTIALDIRPRWAHGRRGGVPHRASVRRHLHDGIRSGTEGLHCRGARGHRQHPGSHDRRCSAGVVREHSAALDECRVAGRRGLRRVGHAPALPSDGHPR